MAEEDISLDPYWHRRTELSIEQGCLLWGGRVGIPVKLQRQVLEELHEGHLGVVKMKSLARGLVWWPGLDKEIEKVTQSCSGCQKSRQDPKVTTLHPWELPDGSGKRIHLDFASPVEVNMLLSCGCILKVARSSANEGHNAEYTIEEVRTLFARGGGGASCSSCDRQWSTILITKFREVFEAKRHQTYKNKSIHPATNGLAEQFVQTLKKAIKASMNEAKSLRHRITNVLISIVMQHMPQLTSLWPN